MATALLVLDMLTDFTSGKLANPAATQITEPIAELIQAARLRDDWMVVYGNDAHRPSDFELSVFGEHAMADSPGAAVIEELARYPGTSSSQSATTPPSLRPTSMPPAGCIASTGWS